MAAAAGLYDPQFEHDACGVGFVADLSGRGGHDVVDRALRVLCHLDHRGAKGGDPDTGDGAGILTQIPDEFFRAACGFPLPAAGTYAAGMALISSAERAVVTRAVERLAEAEGLTVLGWRDVPYEASACGAGARAVMPELVQLFVAGDAGQSGAELERMVFCLRKRAEHEAGAYFASLSARTIVYKGMLSATQLGPFYPDLSDPRYGSALALVHSRFSTNTFPSWPLAHPYRYVAHNGEINTIRGNRNWMRAREAMLASDLIPASRGRQTGQPIAPELQPGPVVVAHPAATVLALLALRSEKAGKIERMVATVFEPASENGQKGMDELHEQTVNLLSFQELPKNVFDIQVAFNMVPRYGQRSELALDAVSQRIRKHYRRIAGGAAEPALQVLQAPVFHGHGFSVYLEMEKPVAIADWSRALAGEHVVVSGSPEDTPTNVSAAGQGDILVAITIDANHKNGVWLWATTDNLRVAALTAVECAESMTASRPRGQIQ